MERLGLRHVQSGSEHTGFPGSAQSDISEQAAAESKCWLEAGLHKHMCNHSNSVCRHGHEAPGRLAKLPKVTAGRIAALLGVQC